MASGSNNTPNIVPLQKYVKDSSGATVIPASRRPDGTWRKEIRVKEGFVPQEEIPVYKTRQEVAKVSVPAGPFGLDPSLLNQTADKPLSKNAKKRAKQKEKKAQEADDAADKLKNLSVSK